MGHSTGAAAIGPEPAGTHAMAEPEIYIGRQPIVDKERSLVAFELLFRAADGSSEAGNSAMAAAGVIVNAFTEFSVQDTVGPHRGFIDVGRELLMSDVLAALPPQRIALEPTGTIEPDDAVIARCKQLRAAGYRLALDQSPSSTRA